MKIKRIHHVRFASPKLDETEAFAADFGLHTAERTDDRLVMRTVGGDAFCYVAERAEAPGFIGLAFQVEGPEDLEDAVNAHGAEPVRHSDLPGGGQVATLRDPNGFAVYLVHGVAGVAPGEASPDLQHNSPVNRTRYGANQHKRPLAPPTLFRLGHLGMFVKDFRESLEWYGRVLGLIGSDIYHVPGVPQAEIVGFLRLNRGEDFVDHHTLAIFQHEHPDCHHISFETQDFEAQFVAHRWLQSRGYESIWGVGRHPHGSHIFDVWRDPNGYRFETFSDTDLLQASSGTRRHDISQVQMDEWSSEPPDRYFA